MITRDGPLAVMMPASLAEWQEAAVLLGSSPPQFDFPLQESSGSLVDAMNGAVLTPSATVPLYQQSITGWNAKGVGAVNGTAAQGFLGASRTLWTIGTQSVVVYLQFLLTTSTSLTELLSISGANYRIVTPNGNGKVELVPGSLVGTVDYRDSLVHPLMIEILPGAGVINHTGAGLVRVTTDKEQFTGTWGGSLGNDSKGLFAIAGQVAPSAIINKLEAWIGSEADTLSAVTPRLWLQRRGWV